MISWFIELNLSHFFEDVSERQNGRFDLAYIHAEIKLASIFGMTNDA